MFSNQYRSSLGRLATLHGAILPGITATALLGSLSAQSITIPLGYQSHDRRYEVEGNGKSEQPFAVRTKGCRTQCIYDASHFSRQGIGGVIVIERLRWRADGLAAKWTGGRLEDVTIRMASSPRTWSTASNAFINNLGRSYSVAFQGAVNVQGKTQRGGTPGEFYVEVQLARPFTYSPVSGKDLVIEISSPGKWSPAQATSFPCDAVSGFPTQGWASGTTVTAAQHNAVVGQVQKNLVPIVELSYRGVFGTFVSFKANQTYVAANTEVTFESTSLSSSPLLSYTWDFGDGNRGFGRTVKHTYACGTYRPKLTVTNQNRQSFSMEAPRGYLRANRLTANILKDVAIGAPPLTVNFRGHVSGSAKLYRWDFGDGTTSTLRSPTHTYTKRGAYDVTLTVTGSCGNRYTVVRENEIRVRDCLPTTVLGQAGTDDDDSGSFFDVDVRNRRGIRVTELEVRSRSRSTTVEVEVYLTRGSYKGRTLQPEKWLRVASGFGRNGRSDPRSRSVIDVEDFLLPPGKWGVFILFPRGGFHDSFGDGTYSNSDLIVTTGAMQTGRFRGRAISRRSFNGSICYEVPGTAAVGRYGPGCIGSNNRAPNLSLSSPPVAGSTVRLHLTDMQANGGIAWLFLGMQHREIDLLAIGAPRCFLHLDVLQTIVVGNTGGEFSTSVSIPAAVPAGLPVFLQAGCVDWAANGLGATASNGLALRFGQ